MYADRVEAASRRSIQERLNDNVTNNSSFRIQVTGKRQRQDDKWEHDLYDHPEPRISNSKVGVQDLRLKLQKKNLKPKQSSVRDLREKLSGTMNPQPVNADPVKRKPETAKPARKSVAVETSETEIKKAAIMVPRKKSRPMVDTSVGAFLQSLGLGKYLITFQAEEVDMTALEHMTDEDLKALGMPMLAAMSLLYLISFLVHLAASGSKKEDTFSIGV